MSATVTETTAAAVRPDSSARVTAVRFEGDEAFPNSTKPLLIYHNVLDVPGATKPARLALAFESVLHGNGWGDGWRDGIYPYNHYHSTAHEFLGVYAGTCKVLLGGDKNGKVFEVAAGDGILIPAGVSHKNVGQSDDFACVGAYPDGTEADMNYGKPGERPQADQNIAKVPLPKRDPLFGDQGPVKTKW